MSLNDLRKKGKRQVTLLIKCSCDLFYTTLNIYIFLVFHLHKILTILLARKVVCVILDFEFVQMKLNCEILSDENISREQIFVFQERKKQDFSKQSASLTITTFSAQPECLEYLYI